MKLYWFWSFNPQKVRFALHELDIAHDLVAVDLFRGQQRHPDFARLNPAARVPVLEDGELVLSESNAIVAYLGERANALWPHDARGRGEGLRWLFFESRHLSEPIGALWFNDFVVSQAGLPVNAERRERGAAELPSELALVETRLGANEFLFGAEFSLVDCCYGPPLDALSLSNFDLAPYPNVNRYLATLRHRPAWAKCEFRTKS